jgi:hypothetical protein
MFRKPPYRRSKHYSKNMYKDFNHKDNINMPQTTADAFPLFS